MVFHVILQMKSLWNVEHPAWLGPARPQLGELNIENDTNVAAPTLIAHAEPSDLEIGAERQRRRTAWEATYAPRDQRFAKLIGGDFITAREPSAGAP
jgi:hypothetical protein